MERIRTLAVLDEHFEPKALPPEPFANSIGVHTGSPELIEIEFTGDAADYVREREWHRSQEFVDRADGSLLLRLCVCNDRPLRSWNLSFGPLARVVAPLRLAQDVFQAFDEARQRYASRLTFEMARRQMSATARETPAVKTRHWRAS